MSGPQWVQPLRQAYLNTLGGARRDREVVLVTGAFGQIGRDFMPILRQIFGPRHVIASDIAKPRKSEINFENLQMIELDVCDKGAVRDAVKSFKVTKIVHLATMLSAVGEKLPIKGAFASTSSPSSRFFSRRRPGLTRPSFFPCLSRREQLTT